MHELSIAQSILEIAENNLPPGNTARVKAVRMRIGDLAGVVIDSLEFCYSAITPGTRLEGSRLDIERVPVLAHCRACGTRFPVLDNAYLCPSCESTNITMLSGTELQVTELELFDTEG